MVENSFPTQGVSAIGLKLLGKDGSFTAADLPMSLTAASFQVEGTVEHAQHKLNKLCRAIRRDGHWELGSGSSYIVLLAYYVSVHTGKT